MGEIANTTRAASAHGLERAAVDAPPLEDGLSVVRYGGLVERRRIGGGGEVERQLLLHAVEHVERVQWRDDGHAVEEGWICVGRRKVGVEDAHQVAELVHTDEAVLRIAGARDARLKVVEPRHETVADGLALGHVARHGHDYNEYDPTDDGVTWMLGESVDVSPSRPPQLSHLPSPVAPPRTTPGAGPSGSAPVDADDGPPASRTRSKIHAKEKK